MEIWFQWWKCWSFNYLDGDLDVKFCRRQGRKWELSRMPIMHANFLLCTNIWLNSYNAAGSTFIFNEKKISLKGCENRDWKLIVCFSQTQELRGFTLLCFTCSFFFVYVLLLVCLLLCVTVCIVILRMKLQKRQKGTL